MTPRGVFAKLVTVFLVIGLVPFLGMSYWTYQKARKEMTETVVGYWLVRIARETAVQLDREVARMRDLVRGWAENEVLAADLPLAIAGDATSQAKARTRLKDYLRNRHKTRRDQIDYMIVMTRDGLILADSLPPDGKGEWRAPLTGQNIDKVLQGDDDELGWIRDTFRAQASNSPDGDPETTLSAMDWHRSGLLLRARKGLTADIRPAGPSRDAEDHCLGISGGVTPHNADAAVGVVVVIFNWRRIQGILDDVQFRFGEPDRPGEEGARYDSGYGFLFANDRDTIIAHKRNPGKGDPSDYRPFLGNSLINDHKLKVFHDQMADMEYGDIHYEHPPGTSKISGFAHTATPEYGGFSWYVGMGIDDVQILTDVMRLRRMLWVSALIVTGLVILGAAVFSHRITEPITRLIRYTVEVAHGNLDARVNVGTRDEIAVLAQSFNEMAANLKESNRRLIDAEKNAAWQEMARQVAHEIKNPLTPIKLSAQQISRAYQDRHVAFEDILTESVDSIISQCESLQQIASDFAAFAAFRDRALKDEDVSEVIESAVRPYLETVEPSTVETSFVIRVPEGTRFLADRGDIHRAVLNLMNNAREATSASGGTIKVEATIQDDNGAPHLRLSIADNGRGIPPEDRKHLFEPYFSTRTGGTGLGLALCKKVADGHHGRIEVQSTVGQGTTMTLILPVKTPARG